MAGVDDVTKQPSNQVFYRPITPAAPSSVTSSKPQTTPAFDDLLRRQMERSAAVRFSAHAQKRLAQAQIDFGPDKVAKLEGAVNQAAAKGARASLVLMKDLALVVNIPNRTVITAVEGERMRQNVFTNIDSAVLTDA